MSNANLLTGVALGLQDAEERNYRRGLTEKAQATADAERERQNQREDVSDARAGVTFDNQQEDRTVANLEHAGDRKRTLEQRTLGDAEHTEDRTTMLGDRKYKSAREKVVDSREDTAWHQSQESAAKKLKEEGLHDLVTGLRSGMTAQQVEQTFNQTGGFKVRPGSLQYDKATDNVSFVGEGGQAFNGSLKSLETLFAPPPILKLKDDETLVDPRNPNGPRQASPKAQAAARAGVGAGRKISPFNPEGASSAATKIVQDSLGMRWDSNLNKFIIPDGMSEKISHASGLAGQIVRHFGDRIRPEEAGAMAVDAARDIKTYQQAQAQAQREVGTQDPEKIKSKVEQIMLDDRTKAAQRLNKLVSRKELEVTQMEEAASGGGAGGPGLADAEPQGAPTMPPTGQSAAPAGGSGAVRRYNPQTRSFIDGG